MDKVSTLRHSDFIGGIECNLSVTVFTTCSGDWNVLQSFGVTVLRASL